MKKINGYYFGIKKDKSKNLYEVAVTNPEDHFQKYILQRSFARLLLFLIRTYPIRFIKAVFGKSHH